MDQRTPPDLHSDMVAAARAVSLSAGQRAQAEDRDDGFPAADVADLVRLGLLAAPIPSDLGGSGLGEEPGAWKLADVLRLVGYGSLALGRLYEGHVNALQLIAQYGDLGQRARLFADAGAGHLFGVWNTEPPGGGVVIEDCVDGSRLGGVKTFASGSGFVTRALVTGRSPGGETLMLVVPLPAGARADLSAWRAHGMRASATGTLDFNGLALLPDAVLGNPDDYFRQPVFSSGAWRFTAVQLGGIEAVFDVWRAHLVGTGREADPHQLARLGEGAIAVEGARQWVARAAAMATDADAGPRTGRGLRQPSPAGRGEGRPRRAAARPALRGAAGLPADAPAGAAHARPRHLPAPARTRSGPHRRGGGDLQDARHGGGPLERGGRMIGSSRAHAAPGREGRDAAVWRDAPQRYGRISRGFHWLMAALFAWQFAGALLYVGIGDTALTRFVGGSHFTLGATLFVLALLRGAWGLANLPRRLPHPGRLGRAAQRATPCSTA